MKLFNFRESKEGNMKIIIIGGAGFIGTNLVLKLAEENEICVVDKEEVYFEYLKSLGLKNVIFKTTSFDINTDFNDVVRGYDIVYHLASTNIPGNSNKHIPEELESNIIVTAKMLDACVAQSIKKVIFISSGGAVYGKNMNCPLEEDMPTWPISTYGIQKLAIEKLLHLYKYQKGLDYRVVRLANPYGPYQRPNGDLGVVTTFVYKALKGEALNVYGDGSVVRDFIYIDDAICGILNIVNGEYKERVFNLGSGVGTSINEVISAIKKALNIEVKVNYVSEGRATDVPVNFLNISRYEKAYGKLNPVDLSKGIVKTAEFLKNTLID